MGDLGKTFVAKGFKKFPKANKSPDLVTLLPIYMSSYSSPSIKELHDWCFLIKKTMLLLNYTALNYVYALR